MKKNIVLTLFLILYCLSAFAQNAFKDVSGSYEAMAYTDGKIDYIGLGLVLVEVSPDYNIQITELYEGLYIEHLNAKLSPWEGSAVDGGYYFIFKNLDKNSKLEEVHFLLHDEVIIENTDYNISVTCKDKNGRKKHFVLRKKNGILPKPKKNLDLRDLHKAETITGKTKKSLFGDYRILWYEDYKMGYLEYEHLNNDFTIRIDKNNKYVLEDDRKFFNIQFDKNYSSSKAKVLYITEGLSLLDSKKIAEYKEWKKIENENDLLKQIGFAFYDMISKDYLFPDDYTSLFEDKTPSEQKLIHFIKYSDRLSTVSGGFKNNKVHGTCIIKNPMFFGKGDYDQGKQTGYHFEHHKLSHRGSGQYVNGLKEGIWEITFEDNRSFDIEMKNNIEVKRTETTKTEESLKIKKHIDYQIDLANVLKQNFDEMHIIESQCESKIGTLENYEDFQKFQSCLTPLSTYINRLNDNSFAGDQQLVKAIEDSKNEGCEKMTQIFINAEKNLWGAKVQFQRAKEALSEFHHGKSPEIALKKYENYIAEINSGIKNLNEYRSWIDMAKIEKCYKKE